MESPKVMLPKSDTIANFGNTKSHFFYFSNDICNETGVGNITMCPNCERHCPFWHLESSCVLSKLTYAFDNDMTVFFAIFMSFWGK